MNSFSAVVRRINEYGPKRTIVWAGAGISCSPPTSLPLGGPLTDFALKATCGNGFQTFIRQVWERVDQILRRSSENVRLGGYPRLESMLQATVDCETALLSRDHSFLSGFQSFANTPVNENHSLIAEFLRLGGRVVTTNFDTCIEDACLQRHVTLDPTKIWHIHGSIASIPELGVTIARVKKGLKPQFASWLTKRLASGVCLIFVGYSASDFFDVNVYFSQLSPNTVKRSAAVFVKHGSTPIPESAKRMLSAFQNKIFVHADTARVLRKCCGGKKIKDPPELHAPNLEWEEGFFSIVGTSLHKAWPLLIVRICNVLGVSAFMFDNAISKRCHRLKRKVDSAFYHETMALLHRTAGNDRSHLYHERKRSTALDAHTLLSYYVTTRRMEEASRIAWSVPKIVENARRGAEASTWFLLGSIKVHVRQVIGDVLAGRGLPGDKAAICHDLLAITEELGARGYKDVIDLKENANSMRLTLLLSAILQQPIEAGMQDELVRTYTELSCVDGLAHSLRDFSICDSIRAALQKDQRLLPVAKSTLAKAREISRATGDAIELERIDELRRINRKLSSKL